MGIEDFCDECWFLDLRFWEENWRLDWLVLIIVDFDFDLVVFDFCIDFWVQAVGKEKNWIDELF